MEALKNIKGIDTAVALVTAEVTATQAKVKEALAPYINGVVTAETIQAWKGDRAKLNKERANYKSERTGLEKAWASTLAPISDVYKAIDKEYGLAIDNIDRQTKEFEAKRIKEKQLRIQEIFTETEEPEGIEGWLTLKDVYDPRWENVTFTEAKIKKAIEDHFSGLKMMYDTIKSLNHSFEEEGLKALRTTRNLQAAISRMNDLKAVEEARKAREEAERKEKEEAERRAKEEAKKAEERKEEPEIGAEKILRYDGTATFIPEGFGTPEPETDSLAGFEPTAGFDDFEEGFGIQEETEEALDGFGTPEPEMIEYVVRIRKDCERKFVEMLQANGCEDFYRKEIVNKWEI